MTRLKLPAYGKRLLDDRRAGLDLLDCAVVFGEQWFKVRPPLVALKPAEYAPGRYDFRVLAGLRATLHCQHGDGWEIDYNVEPPRYGLLYDLVREIADADALVVVRWPQGIEPRESYGFEMAHCCRYANRATRRYEWPRWWSDGIDAQQRKRAAEWLADTNRKLNRGRKAA